MQGRSGVRAQRDGASAALCFQRLRPTLFSLDLYVLGIWNWAGLDRISGNRRL